MKGFGAPPGIKNGMAKLSDHTVKWIRTTYDSGNMSGTKIAQKLGVSHSTVYEVLRHRRWRHVK